MPELDNKGGSLPVLDSKGGTGTETGPRPLNRNPTPPKPPKPKQPKPADLPAIGTRLFFPEDADNEAFFTTVTRHRFGLVKDRAEWQWALELRKDDGTYGHCWDWAAAVAAAAEQSMDNRDASGDEASPLEATDSHESARPPMLQRVFSRWYSASAWCNRQDSDYLSFISPILQMLGKKLEDRRLQCRQ